MVENGFVFAVNKSLEKQRKEQIKKDKKTDKFYAIMQKYNTDLETITKDILLKSEYKFLIEYITIDLKYPLSWYPNLQ
jgi:hypothetical protein